MTLLQSQIDAAVAASASLVIPEGFHDQASPLVMDLSGSSTECGWELKRPDVRGNGRGTTVLRGMDAALNGAPLLKVTGGASGWGPHQDNVLSDFTLTNQDDRDWPNMMGVHLFNSAFLSMQNMDFFGFGTAIKLESHLSASHRNIRIREGLVGIDMSQGGGSSPVNAVHFRDTKLSFLSKWAIKANIAYGDSFDGFNVESCGTQGDLTTGGISFTTAGGKGLHLSNGWFEANAGNADVVLINTDPNHYVTHVIDNCYFLRTSASNFTQHNIVSQGKNRIVLVGNQFQGAGSYVANSSRLYVQGDGQQVVTCIGNDFGSAIEKGTLANL